MHIKFMSGNLALCRPLSQRHGASPGGGWRRRPPDMEGSCEYSE